MSTKSVQKGRQVVPWRNHSEWDQVRDHLYCSDTNLQKHALNRISAWMCRYVADAPVAVACTSDLVHCQVVDETSHLEEQELVLLYGMALVRFVNLITERRQGRVARSLRGLAGRLRIPEWVVNLRHDVTHKNLPSLTWCRKGCHEALDWLQRHYWSRQLGRDGGDWEIKEEEEDEKDQAARQREMEAYRKVRELLISYENEQFEGSKGRNKWPAPFAEVNWILDELKQCSLESCSLVLDVLLEDGFLVPTTEQLEALGCDLLGSVTDPQLPLDFLRFWLPLLRTLHSLSFIHLLLEKLFSELQLLCTDPNPHRTFYLSAWISEVLQCNARRSDSSFESKGQRRARLRDRIFVNRVPLRWQQLLTACMSAPCVGSLHLLRLILDDMDHPLPQDTQDNYLTLCSIYTQDRGQVQVQQQALLKQPLYTLDSLHLKLQAQRRPRGRELDGTGPQGELSDRDAEKARLLRGSPWQLCSENIPWGNCPLGSVPGQSEEPDHLLLENFSLMTALDQTLEMETPPQGAPRPFSAAAKSEAPVWSQSDVTRIKCGMTLF